MSLRHVWLRTLGDGLVRCDQVVGIDAHQTPQLTGKRSHWLIDIVLPASVGNGMRGEWDMTVLHRTLVQTSQPPGDAATALARLLARLDAADAAGVVHVSAHPEQEPGGAREWVATDDSRVAFRFVPFGGPPPP